MANEKKTEIKLPSLDELFSSQEERDDAKLKRIYEIPLSEIDPFPRHPFKVRDDEDMMHLAESIQANGIITPATVRRKDNGRFELLSGHRRKRACEIAGLDTMRCEVVEMDRDEATVFMVESNFQRTTILPSEKAFAYKMRLEAMKRQGKRTDLTCATPLQRHHRTRDWRKQGNHQEIYPPDRTHPPASRYGRRGEDRPAPCGGDILSSQIGADYSAELYRSGAVHAVPCADDQNAQVS